MTFMDGDALLVTVCSIYPFRYPSSLPLSRCVMRRPHPFSQHFTPPYQHHHHHPATRPASHYVGFVLLPLLLLETPTLAYGSSLVPKMDFLSVLFLVALLANFCHEAALACWSCDLCSRRTSFFSLRCLRSARSSSGAEGAEGAGAGGGGYVFVGGGGGGGYVLVEGGGGGGVDDDEGGGGGGCG